MHPSRRALLAQAPLAAAVLAAPAAALGAPDLSPALPLHEALRARWAAVRTRTAAGFAGVSPGDDAGGLSGHLVQIVDGLAALDVVKELHATDPVAQCAPGVQALWRDLLVAVGRGSIAAREAAEAWLAPTGEAADPDAAHLRAVLGAMRAGVDQAETTPARRAMLADSLDELLHVDLADGTRGQVRRRVRKQRRTERLAALLAADPEARRRHLHDDRRAAPLLAAGATAPASDDPLDEHHELDGEATAAALGMLLLGVVIAAGLFISVTVVCVGLCAGAGGAVALGVLGIALMALAIRGMVTLRDRRREAEDEDAAAAAALDGPGAEVGRLPAGSTLRVSLHTPGWSPTGLVCGPPSVLVARAYGAVQGPRPWPVDPDGDGTAAGPTALLPGAPHGSLVGKIGEEPFFIGAEREVPAGLSGPLSLGLNLAPGEELKGGLEVELTHARAAGGAE